MTGKGISTRTIQICTAAALLLAGCSSHPEPQSARHATAPEPGPSIAAPASANEPRGSAQVAVRAVVKRFGTRMQTISILAPPDDVRSELDETYGKLITPELMAAWKAHPAETVGREGSSPWPTQIAIREVDCSAPTACRVSGVVDYITSNELEHGGVLYQRDISLFVTRSGQGWRIAEVKLAPSAASK